MNKPLRVAHVVGKVVISGVDSVVMNYYRHIDRTKVQFDFFMDGYEKTPLDDEILSLGGRIYKLEPYEQNMLKNIGQCYTYFKENKYQIVHSHLNTLSIFPLAAAWKAKVPVRIAHNHSTTAKGEIKRSALKYALRPFSRVFATHYAACGEYAGQWLFGKHAAKKGRIYIVRNAVDICQFNYKPDIRDKVRSELDLGDSYIIGHVGRFVYPKNHDFLIDIFAEVQKKDKNTKLLLVGSGELEESIKIRVHEYQLDKNVIFLGLRRDVPDLLQAIDIFCLPSHYEGFPVVGVEAQATGLFCLFSAKVPPEAAITDRTSFFDLHNEASLWADKLLEQKNAQSRCSYTNEITTAGFEINTAAQDLTHWYESLVKA